MFSPCLNQRQLLRARQTFDLHFALQRAGLVGTVFVINQLHRRASARVLRPLACIMQGKTLAQVVGDTTVQRTFGTFEQVAHPVAFMQRCHYAALSVYSLR